MKTWAAANGRRGELGLRPAASFAEGPAQQGRRPDERRNGSRKARAGRGCEESKENSPEEGDFAAAGVGEEHAVARAFLEEEERRKQRVRRMTRGTH